MQLCHCMYMYLHIHVKSCLFSGSNFVVCQLTVKAAKIGPLENFHLYITTVLFQDVF